jgi:hypothetical protein
MNSFAFCETRQTISATQILPMPLVGIGKEIFTRPKDPYVSDMLSLLRLSTECPH